MELATLLKDWIVECLSRREIEKFNRVALWRGKQSVLKSKTKRQLLFNSKFNNHDNQNRKYS
jgi:hypothetical protein